MSSLLIVIYLIRFANSCLSSFLQHNGELVGLMYVVCCSIDVPTLLNNFDVKDYDNLVMEKKSTGRSPTHGHGLIEHDVFNFAVNAFQIKAFFVLPEFMDRSIDFVEVR